MIAEAELVEVAGLVFDEPHDVYHARTLGVASKSALDRVHQSPMHYLQWLREETVPTPAMRFGSLFHQYVLELPKALASIAVVPDFGDCRKTLSKEAKAAWIAENDGKEHISQEDWDAIRFMGDAVHRHPIAAKLLAASKPEVVARWTDVETGLPCKLRADAWAESYRIILDLKSTADASPREFAKSCASFRYHVQQSFYTDGFEAVGKRVKAFLFIAVEKTAPYAVATYQLDDDAVSLGREAYRADMAKLANCCEAERLSPSPSNFPAYGEGITELSLPRWAYTTGV